MKSMLVILKHRIVKKALSYVVCIVVGALGLSYMQFLAKQGAYAEVRVQQVDMDCYPTRKHTGDEA